MSAAAQRPISFSADMVAAILRNTKTMTRRTLRPQPDAAWVGGTGNGRCEDLSVRTPGACAWWNVGGLGGQPRCKYGGPGDGLWVREAWRTDVAFDDLPPSALLPPPRAPMLHYPAGPLRDNLGGRVRASMYMPRWASRISLGVVETRIERLSDISSADAIAEGIERLPDGGYGLPDGRFYHATDPRFSFWALWESINGAGTVAFDPFLWVITFSYSGSAIGSAHPINPGQPSGNVPASSHPPEARGRKACPGPVTTTMEQSA